MLKEFKAFAMRGNMIDMAVGIIIGSAFGKIVNSLVQDILMPFLGMLLGKVDFSDLAIILHEKTATSAAVAIKYGIFITAIIDFVIIAFAMFLVVKQMNRFSAPKEVVTKECPYCCSNI